MDHAQNYRTRSDNWRSKAACKGYSQEMFSRNDLYLDDRDKSISLTKEDRRQIEYLQRLAREDEDDRTAEGKRICAECPVRLSCLSFFFEEKQSNDLMYGGFRMWVEDERAQAEYQYTHL